jgi:hypothetical protein
MTHAYVSDRTYVPMTLSDLRAVIIQNMEAVDLGKTKSGDKWTKLRRGGKEIPIEFLAGRGACAFSRVRIHRTKYAGRR